MNLLNHYPEIVAAYPEYITQKQFCEVCGVCHKTAYNLGSTEWLEHLEISEK